MQSLIEIQIAFEKNAGQWIQADPDPADPETSQTHTAAHLRGS